MLIIIPLVIIFVITYVYCYKPKFRSSKTLYSSRQVQNASYFILTQPIRQSLSLRSLIGFIPGSCLRLPPLMELNGLLLWQISSLLTVLILLGLRQSSLSWREKSNAGQNPSFQPCHNLPEALSMPAPILVLSSEIFGGFCGT